MNFTPIARKFFGARLQQLHDCAAYPEATQRGLLAQLLGTASYSEYGQKLRFATMQGYSDFRAAVPLVAYEDIKPHIMRMLHGEKNILWPGRVRNFAQSSGTSDGKSKYIPITDEALAQCHYQGAADAVALYLNMNPGSRLFAGKAFILGGSFANELTGLPSGTRVGDLSATLIRNITPLAALMRVPSKRIALMSDWEQKLPALVRASAKENVTNISGVPSWFLTVLRQLLDYTGADNVHQVWPQLEVFFHGGISFDPYREQYREITDPAKMHFVENYNASEGFFAVQSSPESNAMMLLLDVGVFYEFIPLEQADSDNPDVLPLWEVEQGRTYALVITTCGGLWRYKIGDTVRVESLAPLKIRIVGRTKSFINAFGEELMVHNATAAIAKACELTGAEIADYTAAPLFSTDRAKARHQWLVEFAVPPTSLIVFTGLLDDELKRLNSDYEAKRSKDIFLDMPEVITAPKGLFDLWLATTGKRGGQRKVPRLCNDRKAITAMLRLADTMTQ